MLSCGGKVDWIGRDRVDELRKLRREVEAKALASALESYWLTGGVGLRLYSQPVSLADMLLCSLCESVWLRVCAHLSAPPTHNNDQQLGLSWCA